MTRLMSMFVAVCVVAVATPGALADGHDAYAAQIKARQGLMRVYALNLGILGSMAKGETEYDAEAAATAASNLVLASDINQRAMWPQGSTVEALGEEVTKAKAAGWERFEEISKHDAALSEAAATLAEEAGNGLDAVRANLGDIGDSCKGCHEISRVSD